LKGQYRAALAMLRQGIEKCPDKVWTSGEHPRTVWRIAYHALFYAHFYMQTDHESFVPWERHRDQANFTEAVPWPPFDRPCEVEPYTREDMIEYCAVVDGLVGAGVDRLDLDAQECGFPWYSMPKLDHQILNIRHIQEHSGQIAEHLNAVGIDVDWVGMGPVGP